MFRDGRRLHRRSHPDHQGGRPEDIPAVGERRAAIHTPTVSDVGGNLGQIDTRSRPTTCTTVDFADVLGKEPVVLLFATPALCESRVCGPVVDVAEQVKHEYGDGVDFIHMEIYDDNNASDGPPPAAAAYGLQTEPWLFVIDRRRRRPHPPPGRLQRLRAGAGRQPVAG